LAKIANVGVPETHGNIAVPEEVVEQALVVVLEQVALGLVVELELEVTYAEICMPIVLHGQEWDIVLLRIGITWKEIVRGHVELVAMGVEQV